MEVFPNAPPLNTIFDPTTLSSPVTLYVLYNSTGHTLLKLLVECLSFSLYYKLCENRDHFCLVLDCSAQQGARNIVGTHNRYLFECMTDEMNDCRVDKCVLIFLES